MTSREALLVPLRDVRHHVPRQVHRAPLLLGLGQHLARSGGEPGVLVADDEPHAGQAALDELDEQLGPARFRLRHADVDAEQVTLVVGADAIRDERGHVLDAARPPCVDERRVEVQVRERLGDALPAQLVDLVLESLGHAAHGRLADALSEQRLGDAGHVSRRQPAHVRLGHGIVNLSLPPRVPSERCGCRATGTRTPHAHRHLAGGGNHVPVVPAVPDVDALVTALVWPGPDESLQLLVQDDLDGRLHRATHALC